MVWIGILFFIFVVLGCYVAYKETKIHELHKMRACFENKRQVLGNILDTTAEADDNKEMLRGEIVALEDMIHTLEEEAVHEDVIESIKGDLDVLKRRVEHLFGKK